MTILAFDRVTMRSAAGIVEILKDISLTVAAGDFIALVGPSGAGKSSLLRLMNRLSEASAGQILFEGQDIRQLPVVSLRSQITLVNQESRLLGMDVRTALGYPLRLRGQSATDISAAVQQWSTRLKIPEDWMTRTAVNLSLGQRQRVAIARALISQPKILLLDEPTSAQDIGYSEFLLSRLAELTRQNQLTVIMANHQLALTSRYVTRLWHMENGKLIADLPAEQVGWQQLQQALIDAEKVEEEDWN